MAANADYDIGQLVRSSVTFEVSGTPTDPGGVFVEYRSPSGVETTLEYGTDAALVKDDTGDYHVDIDADEGGDWYGRWYSTGNGQAAKQFSFKVAANKAT